MVLIANHQYFFNKEPLTKYFYGWFFLFQDILMKKQTFLIVIFLVASTIGSTNARVPIPPPAPPQRTQIVEVQPDGIKINLLRFYSQRDALLIPNYSYSYETLEKKIPVIKNKENTFVLATKVLNNKLSCEKKQTHWMYKLTDIRAESPYAIKKKVTGKWHFFIPETGMEVPYDTNLAILPDWPESSVSSLGWFSGKFKPDGSPIYSSPNIPIKCTNNDIERYRTPFAGSINIWILIVLTSIIFLKKRGTFKVRDNTL